MKCLYNGVKLSVLPERDKVKLPYCIIVWSEIAEGYQFYFFDRPIFYTEYVQGFVTPYYTFCVKNVSTENNDAYGYGYQDGNTGEWADYIQTLRFPYDGTNEVVWINKGYELIWSSHDILDDNGNVYFQGSDPVPMLKKGSCSCKPVLFPPSGIGGKDTWKKIAMNINEGLMPSYIWTDGTNIYYSKNGSHYVLNGRTWEPKTWYGYTDFNGDSIWTDGVHIYASGGDTYQYVLDGDTWIVKEWKFEFASAIAHLPSGDDIWTDGNQIYHSYFNGSYQYVLDGDTWKDKNWNIGLAGGSIWSDGIAVYGQSYSSGEDGCYQLINGVWGPKTWNIDPVAGGNIWTDGENVYLSTGSKHYALRDGIWYPQTWNGHTQFSGGMVWSDGVSMYTYGYVPGTLQFDSHYVLTGSGPDPTAILMGFLTGAKL